MTLTISENEADAPAWDAFGRTMPGWTAFHRAAWRGVFESALGHSCHYLAARDGSGALAGILPLVRVRSLLFGDYLVSVPFLNYGGPLGTPEAVRALAESAVARARADGVRLLELRSRVALDLDLPVSHRKITVVLDLPDSHDGLMKAFPAKLRSQVRRPDKEGVRTEFGPEHLDAFYDVFSRHMHSLGTPVMPRRFFAALPAAFGESFWLGCSYHQGVAVACGAGFVWNDEFEMTWASSLASHNRIAANMGLYAAFMRRAVDAGLRRFNFGRCSPGSGTHRFKAQWGSRDEPLHWYQFARGGAAGTPSPDSGPYAMGPRLWKRLPLAIANRAGPVLSRLIP